MKASNKIKDDWVPFDIVVSLKEKGFDEFCEFVYSPSYRHNGVEISFEEELDLKAEGRENEIEEVEGGLVSYMPNRNSENDDGVYSMPTVNVVCKWLRRLGVHISTVPYVSGEGVVFGYYLYRIQGYEADLVCRSSKVFPTSEDAFNGAIGYVVGKIVRADGGEGDIFLDL